MNDKIKIKINVSGDNMKIKELQISGIGGIGELELDFNQGFNVICGANGIGKTTILNTICDAFSNNKMLKRNASYKTGKYTITYTGKQGVKQQKYTLNAFSPNERDSGIHNMQDTKDILPFDINRTIKYMSLQAIPKDPGRDIADASRIAGNGITMEDMKGWFVNRFLFSGKKDSLSESQQRNYEIAKSAFGLLDSSVSFATVNSGTLDIMLNDKDGTLYFEYLSAGYKTCIYIVLGIIKEIEFRFKHPDICVKDFEGVILIDEIDMHLHPTWQAALVKALKELFPNAQFICTTHSPSLLQSLEKDEIIALGQDDQGRIQRQDLELGEYGLQGWTLEEILRDVMGMPSTTSELFRSTMDAFDQAVYDENIPEIKANYEILDKMLHPSSTLRKLLQIQMVGLEE